MQWHTVWEEHWVQTKLLGTWGWLGYRFWLFMPITSTVWAPSYNPPSVFQRCLTSMASLTFFSFPLKDTFSFAFGFTSSLWWGVVVQIGAKDSAGKIGWCRLQWGFIQLCDAKGYLKSLCIYWSGFERLLRPSELLGHSSGVIKVDDKLTVGMPRCTCDCVAASSLSRILEDATAPRCCCVPLQGLPVGPLCSRLSMRGTKARTRGATSNVGRESWDLTFSVFSL